jgi:ribosomal protein S27AE
MKIRDRYKLNKEAKVGEECVCPSCGTTFIKEHYQQAFCKSKGGTQCKDKYWNTVTPGKRNNTTRISPASAAFMARTMGSERVQGITTEGYRIIDGVAYDEFDEPVYDVDIYNDCHPFSSEGLGQGI